MKTHLLVFVGITAAAFVSTAAAKGPRGPIDPEEVVVEMIAEFDADENNELNSEELYAAVSSRHEQMKERVRKFRKGKRGDRPNRPEPEDISSRLIGRFDESGDGLLDADELAAALTEMRERRPHRLPQDEIADEETE